MTICNCREEDRPYHQYDNITCTDDQWDRLCAWLTGDPTFRSKIERHKKELKEKIGSKRDDSAIEPILPLVPTIAIGAPRRLLPEGGGNKARLRDNYYWQLDFPTDLISPMKVVALAIVFLRC